MLIALATLNFLLGTELESVKSAYCQTLKEVWSNYLNIPMEIIVEDSEEDFEGLDLKILT